MYEQYISMLPQNFVHLVFATLLGLLIGLEREWAEKSAGIRTTSLIAMSGAVFTIISDSTILLATGVLFVIVFSVLLGVRNLISGYETLSLTTSTSLLIAYCVGILAALGMLLEAVTVSVLSSLLLVLKRELHSFAGTLSKKELESVVEFIIISFVVYPVLPNRELGPWQSVNPRVIWLLVIAVSGIGLFNYIIVKKYNEKGFAFTGFFGGLINSTAVVASISEQTQHIDTDKIGVSAILLANGSMAFRNAIIVSVFIPSLIIKSGVPLLSITIVGLLSSYFISQWETDVDVSFDTPFSLKRAGMFGLFFLIIVIVSARANSIIGKAGFLLTSFISGFVSSGSVTMSAIALLQSGTISPKIATGGVLLGTISSMIVKVGFAYSMSKTLGKEVIKWTLLLTVVPSVLIVILTVLGI